MSTVTIHLRGRIDHGGLKRTSTSPATEPRWAGNDIETVVTDSHAVTVDEAWITVQMSNCSRSFPWWRVIEVIR